MKLLHLHAFSSPAATLSLSVSPVSSASRPSQPLCFTPCTPHSPIPNLNPPHPSSRTPPLPTTHSPSPSSSVVDAPQRDFQVEDEFNLLLVDEELLAALKERRIEDAWRVFQFCRKKGHTPSSVCLSRLVAQLSYAGTQLSISRAQEVVASLQNDDKIAFLDCNSLGVLAMASAKAGATRYASKLIRMMLKIGYSPHVKAWSAVVSKLGSNVEDVHLALQLFEDICNRVKESDTSENGGSNVNTDSRFMRPDTGAFNAILNACATAGLLNKGEELFDQMHTFGLKPEAFTFNIMIKLYGNAEQTVKLGEILDRMEEEGVEPCMSTMHSFVAAYVGLGELDRAERLVQALRVGAGDIKSVLKSNNGKANDVVTEDSIQGSGMKLEAARQNDSEVEGGLGETEVNQSQRNAFVASVGADAHKLHKFKPDARMYTILMKGYMQTGRFNDVIQLLIAMQHQEDPIAKPNEVTYTTAISACLKLGALDDGRAILSEMADQQVPANVVTYNVLLNGYCKASQIQKALALFEDMEKARITPDVTSYNTLIDGFISLDDNGNALQVFRKMRKAGIAPSKFSYTTLMKAFGRTGQPRLAAKVFEEMKQDPRITVDVIAWNILIESYSKAGLAEEAKKTLKSMKQEHLQPTIATYGSLVKCFATAGKPGEALVLWNEIRERLEAQNGDSVKPLKPDAGLLDGLVDICVRAGFFQKALEIVACMETHRILADKIKYKRMFVELHSKLFTSKHASQARKDRSADRRQAVEAFKFWVGLPNKYYESDWRS